MIPGTARAVHPHPGRGPVASRAPGNPPPPPPDACIEPRPPLSSSMAAFEVTNPPADNGGVRLMSRCAPGTPHPREHGSSPETVSQRVRFDVQHTR
jgi:hypothetical protein